MIFCSIIDFGEISSSCNPFSALVAGVIIGDLNLSFSFMFSGRILPHKFL